MKYYLALIVNLFCLTSLFAQDELRLVSSRYSTIIDQKGFSSIQPVYSHKGSTLSADSGIIYEDAIGRQFFEAFGNVVITQPSGTIIYADRLHYDAAPQIATLTNNVRMVDATSVLTTNHLIYKMRDKIGTYTGGGRIISKGDTITSKNAYYFENTQDAYFRNKVVVRTPDVKIYTDTMRYNSAQRMTYFFGPTNIKGNKGENLYTEKGNYNTATGVANFSKNNLYTEGTRFLKGDSLHYNRESGLGKAYRNVVFVDTSDKFYAYGGYGLYDQREESITMTDKPLVIMVIQNDSTDRASVTDSTSVDSLAAPNLTAKEKKRKNGRDENKEDQISADRPGAAASDSLRTAPPPVESAKVDSAYMTADTLYSRLILLKDYKALNFNLDRNGGELEIDQDIDYGDDDDGLDDISDGEEPNLPLTDSTSGDSISKLPEEGLKEIVRKTDELKKSSPATVARSAGKTDSAARSEIGKTLAQDSIIRQRAVIPRVAEADSIMNKALLTAQTPDTVIKDTSNQAYLDTARTRIVKAYYNVRMFKSDLQAVADSLYYGMADSMFRFMGRPMIWAEGSQISSDTIYMQIRRQQLDNALLVGNAFMVNAVLDTVKFNQLKGRKITAFFANNSIDRLYVDGNAENLVFSENDKTKTITEMFHDRGARIKIKMENKKIIDYITVRKVDQKVYPFKLVTPENEVLPGFIWRPQDRPKSKEDMINRKREIEKAGGQPDLNEGNDETDRPDKEEKAGNAASPKPGPQAAS
ncbi:OstA-like protein [Sphingobacterium allocomposti]|uniref:OstA-like protein n=1 Tax=Sphingobacterium allocomposti TaxID=415956 RepID=A0A5S5DUA4_9SPHI|nr:OstA-like protein [Sphingobacterium composti Yoo et al. 2007 non Ten et al. 2007]TYP98586.1 OstA-like protein [Sphingobacterium composti Yoo et al. 2007 non Ten et al. 2007]